jgi:hypothetical protein
MLIQIPLVGPMAERFTPLPAQPPAEMSIDTGQGPVTFRVLSWFVNHLPGGVTLLGVEVAEQGELGLLDDPDIDPADPPRCSNPRGHSWVVRDDMEEVSYCEWCGADGNA